MTVGASGFQQADGSFLGSDANIQVGGFRLLGGSFRSTTGTLTIVNIGSAPGTVGNDGLWTTQLVTVTGGTFLHANGTVLLRVNPPSRGCSIAPGVSLDVPLTVYNLGASGFSVGLDWQLEGWAHSLSGCKTQNCIGTYWGSRSRGRWRA
jgi:hypothetical protein